MGAQPARRWITSPLPLPADDPSIHAGAPAYQVAPRVPLPSPGGGGGEEEGDWDLRFKAFSPRHHHHAGACSRGCACEGALAQALAREFRVTSGARWIAEYGALAVRWAAIDMAVEIQTGEGGDIRNLAGVLHYRVRWYAEQIRRGTLPWLSEDEAPSEGKLTLADQVEQARERRRSGEDRHRRNRYI